MVEGGVAFGDVAFAPVFDFGGGFLFFLPAEGGFEAADRFRGEGEGLIEASLVGEGDLFFEDDAAFAVADDEVRFVCGVLFEGGVLQIADDAFEVDGFAGTVGGAIGEDEGVAGWGLVVAQE